jgi:hypothetical protein
MYGTPFFHPSLKALSGNFIFRCYFFLFLLAVIKKIIYFCPVLEKIKRDEKHFIIHTGNRK